MLITTKKNTHRSYSCIQDANDGDKSCSSYIPFTQFTTCKKSVLVVHSSRHAKSVLVVGEILLTRNGSSLVITLTVTVVFFSTLVDMCTHISGAHISNTWI